MSTLYIKFTPPSPTPSQYKIRYKKTTDVSYNELVVTSTGLSPEEFSITGLTGGVNYNVEVQSYCGDGIFADGDLIISNSDDCKTYVMNNTDAAVAHDVEYVLCGSTDVVITTIAPLDSISVCCSLTYPPVSVDGPIVTITDGALCTP
jgi:hypothetical protein